ncbi:MAG: hypothetical protein ACOX7N_03225 [Lawsonibacter sp.]|jgi:hypothetical protein
MSQKKRKKRHSQAVLDAKRQAAQAKLAEEKDRARNRMNPIARNLLFGDLVFLAICQILYTQGMLSEFLSNGATILGIILLVAALYFQFVKGTGGGNSGRWSI